MAVVTFPDPNVIAGDSDNVIVIVYDHWPPSAIAPSDEEPRRGFVNDMLRDIFTAAGYTVIFKSQPVKRGLESVRIGTAHIFAEATPAMLPTLLFPEVPTFAYDGVIWVRMDDPWRYDGAASLRGRRVGNVLGYAADDVDDVYQAFLTNKDTNLVQVSSIDAVPLLFQMLSRGRIDIFAESFLVGQYFGNRLGLSDKIRPAGVLAKPEKLFPAFSPVDPRARELIEIWNKGRSEMQMTGEDKKYLMNYGIMEDTFPIRRKTD